MGRHGVGRAFFRAGRWRLTVLLTAVGAAIVLLLVMSGGWGGGRPGNGLGEGPRGENGPSTATGTAPGWGFTHTQYSADHGETDAMSAADKAIGAAHLAQNQHIMGWGVDNPEPSPGVWNFRDLDRRVALMRSSGSTPVLTLCCAPDWMKGGGPRTDWSQKTLEKAPDPAHYKDFAELASEVAKRYPEVRHFVVWNEFKGFYDDKKNRWDYEDYTRLYNLVYAALKKVDKGILVGGPYIGMDSIAPGETTNASSLRGPWGSVDQRSLDAIDYWNTHKAGADFLTVDGASYTHQGNRLLPDEFTATQKFADVTTWLRSHTGLPVWWSEWYVEPPDANDSRRLWTEQRRIAVQTTAMMQLARAGAAAAFYWNPETTSDDCPGCLWRSTELKGGGEALPMLDLLARFAKDFPPGTKFRDPQVAPDDPGRVRVLASGSAVLVVNVRDQGVTVAVDGRPVSLGPYEIRWVD
ncbi:xylan 1,4-beta-xylosidase [Streptomyces gamaensis]|uniref:Xylan 1,4-beta-xylosidase n=1 Tax=Streptomyces gamaensis TaxID=1763542 RepID=A0ABW0YUW0_9ACTN